MTEQFAIKQGYSTGVYTIGRIVKETAKTVTVNEMNWDGRFGCRECRWLVADVLIRAGSLEEGRARVAAAADTYKAHEPADKAARDALSDARKARADDTRRALLADPNQTGAQP